MRSVWPGGNESVSEPGNAGSIPARLVLFADDYRPITLVQVLQTMQLYNLPVDSERLISTNYHMTTFILYMMRQSKAHT